MENHLLLFDRFYPSSAQLRLLNLPASRKTFRTATPWCLAARPSKFCKFAWRRDHKDQHKLPIWQFADTAGALGRRPRRVLTRRRAYRYTYIVDPDNTIQHVYATNFNVGRAPKGTLHVLDALQTDELCPCKREVGDATNQCNFETRRKKRCYMRVRRKTAETERSLRNIARTDMELVKCCKTSVFAFGGSGVLTVAELQKTSGRLIGF